MKLIELFTADESERAVSPVIGVILMVAITVILAAVIGTFVLGLGDQVQETAPNAQFNWDETSGGELKVTHESGESIDIARLEVTGTDGTTACGSATDWNGLSNSKVTAGANCQFSTVTVDENYRLVWTSEGGDQSSTLTEHTYQG